MLDLKWIRDHPQELDASLARRGAEPVADALLDLDARHRAAQTALQDMQNRRNAASKEIGKAMGSGDKDRAETLKREVAELKSTMQAETERERELSAERDALLAGLPNLLDPDVPDGPDESANVELRNSGEPPKRNFPPKEHFEIGEALGLMDFETASRLSGSRFVVLSGALARMERALAQFMLDIHVTEFGYTEVSPPLLVRDHVLFGTGQLPKFGEDLFQTTSGHWLIPTAEVPLTNLVREQILSEDELPLRYTAWTSCFRSEAGAAGKDTRGMLRQHQFYKVELVSIVHPDQSLAEQERKTGCAEAVMQRLDLPYRVVWLCSGDTGGTMQSTFDVEVWLPGQGVYREIASVSRAGDWQARRMQSRFRPNGEKGTRFVNTLNGSGVAIGRALIAILENHQQADGSVIIPEALRPYMGGLEVLEPNG